jgi:hypothetical protein
VYAAATPRQGVAGSSDVRKCDAIRLSHRATVAGVTRILSAAHATHHLLVPDSGEVPMKRAIVIVTLVIGAAILGATVFSERIAQAAQLVSATIIGPVDDLGNVKVVLARDPESGREPWHMFLRS